MNGSIASVVKTYRKPLLRIARGLLQLSVIAAITSGANAQSEFVRIHGPQDESIPIPSSAIVPSQKDASALQVIVDFIRATNGGTWAGLQAAGTMSVPNGGQEDQSSATLSMSAAGSLRLDLGSANTSAPEQSIRVLSGGAYAEAQESSGTRHALPAFSAGGGLYIIGQLFSTSFPDASTAIIDGGLIILGDRRLHRITIEQSSSPLARSSATPTFRVADLYFDPASSLLVKSAVWDQINSRDREKYLQVMTFGDYQRVGTLLIPFSFSQTLNGQPEWTLQLTSVQPASLPPSFFSF